MQQPPEYDPYGHGSHGHDPYGHGPYGHGPLQPHGDDSSFAKRPRMSDKALLAFLVVGGLLISGAYVVLIKPFADNERVREEDEAKDAVAAAAVKRARDAATARAIAGQREVQADAEALPVSASTIIGAYKANEMAANDRFLGKRVRVSGRVIEIKKDVLGTPYVTVGSSGALELPAVQCLLRSSERPKAAGLRRGESISIVGQVTGLLVNVQVIDCTL